jgi:sulfate adenylyltransferase subunit 2
LSALPLLKPAAGAELESTESLSHLDWLESEGDPHHARGGRGDAQPGAAVLGGKDSIVMLRIAEKAFRPDRFPFPLLHIDTEHNFPEVIAFRDYRAAQLGEQLIVRSVGDSIRAGRVKLRRPDESRNPHQTVTLLDAVKELEVDALFGGARRDEEKARAKERILSFRDEFGQWDPRNQRPELWSLYNARLAPGEHLRVFPISNWTELDIWQYIARENLEVPRIYFAHDREVVERKGLLAPSPSSRRRALANRCDAPCALPHRGRHHLHVPGRLRRGLDRERSSPKPPAPPSPSGAPRAWTTRPPTPPWSFASAKGTSDVVARHRPGTLRFTTAGSVDDGKSTLIGRLLLDAKACSRTSSRPWRRTTSRRGGQGIDLSLFTDGLTAEREQGITIDVAYRYFATPRRRFIIADTPATSSTRATW